MESGEIENKSNKFNKREYMKDYNKDYYQHNKDKCNKRRSEQYYNKVGHNPKPISKYSKIIKPHKPAENNLEFFFSNNIIDGSET